jgi:regulatory protein
LAGPRRAPNSGSPLPAVGGSAAHSEIPGGDAVARTPRGTAKDRALRLLGVRSRSREELRRRLIAAGFEPDKVERALADLQAVGLIDDERFARELARDRVSRRLEGDRMVRSALLRKGVARELADQVVADAGDQDERAADLATRKVARMARLEPQVAYRRLVGLLVRRGHPPEAAREAARRALERADDPCDPSTSAVD